MILTTSEMVVLNTALLSSIESTRKSISMFEARGDSKGVKYFTELMDIKRDLYQRISRSLEYGDENLMKTADCVGGWWVRIAVEANAVLVQTDAVRDDPWGASLDFGECYECCKFKWLFVPAKKLENVLPILRLMLDNDKLNENHDWEFCRQTVEK